MRKIEKSRPMLKRRIEQPQESLTVEQLAGVYTPDNLKLIAGMVDATRQLHKWHTVGMTKSLSVKDSDVSVCHVVVGMRQNEWYVSITGAVNMGSDIDALYCCKHQYFNKDGTAKRME